MTRQDFIAAAKGALQRLKQVSDEMDRSPRATFISLTAGATAGGFSAYPIYAMTRAAAEIFGATAPLSGNIGQAVAWVTAIPIGCWAANKSFNLLKSRL